MATMYHAAAGAVGRDARIHTNARLSTNAQLSLALGPWRRRTLPRIAGTYTRRIGTAQ